MIFYTFFGNLQLNKWLRKTEDAGLETVLVQIAHVTNVTWQFRNHLMTHILRKEGNRL